MNLGDGLKKVFLAGVGAVATTGESAKKIVDELVDKGELTIEQGKVLNEELKHKVKEQMDSKVDGSMKKNYADAMESVKDMSKEELEELKAKIAKAEEAMKEE